VWAFVAHRRHRPWSSSFGFATKRAHDSPVCLAPHYIMIMYMITVMLRLFCPRGSAAPPPPARDYYGARC
jgi:hypothetical protein